MADYRLDPDYQWNPAPVAALPDRVATALQGISVFGELATEYGRAMARIEQLENALRGLYNWLPRYSCKSDAPDGCPVCVARALIK